MQTGQKIMSRDETEEARTFAHQTSMILHTASRSGVLLAAWFGGFAGLHKFLLGAKREGQIYAALFWTGAPAVAGLIDLAELAFAPHANGRFMKRHPADAMVVEKSAWFRLAAGAVVVAAALAAGLLLG